LKVLDLKPAFESQGDPMNLYYKTDPHWNPRGHAVAARELFKAIKAARLRLMAILATVGARLESTPGRQTENGGPSHLVQVPAVRARQCKNFV